MKIDFKSPILTSCLIPEGKNTNYAPIDCGLYDYLEMWSVQKQLLEVTYSDDNGTPCTVIETIKTLKTANKEEFLVFTNQQEIRLDQIISISDNHCN